MRVKNIIDEDFVNYRKPSMFISSVSCNGKCCTEAGIPFSVCQNDEWRKAPVIDIDDKEIAQRYKDNKITKAIVIGGLEPFEQFFEMYKLILTLRVDFEINDDVVIYTGYNKEEVKEFIEELACFDNIIVKFGRFVPNDEKRFDDVLGITLASKNQYAEKIS